jgi:hypothetical protein
MTRYGRRQARTQGARMAAPFGLPRRPLGGDLGPSFSVRCCETPHQTTRTGAPTARRVPVPHRPRSGNGSGPPAGSNRYSRKCEHLPSAGSSRPRAEGDRALMVGRRPTDAPLSPMSALRAARAESPARGALERSADRMEKPEPGQLNWRRRPPPPRPGDRPPRRAPHRRARWGRRRPQRRSLPRSRTSASP